MSQYNLRNPAVKRLMKEAEELRYPTKEYHAQPLDDNLFEWHFTLSGPPNTEFEGGVYHGRITLPPEYPMKPPSIILLTPNGRFETNKKICLSISGFHPESWQPSWSIRTALVAMIGFLPTHGNGAIGSLDYTPEERKELAVKSRAWKCYHCGDIKQYLSEKVNESRGYKLSDKEESPSATPNKTYSNNTASCDGNEKPNNCSSNIESPKPDFHSPSILQEEETLLRHRELQSEHENDTHITESNRDTQSPKNSLSLAIIWVIIIILGILICRRILY